MEIQPKDPSKKHFLASLAKSLVRISACGSLFYGDLQTAAILLVVAELLGIAEELV
jgi:hypothetical protein